jgi:serine/threonine protein kinase
MSDSPPNDLHKDTAAALHRAALELFRTAVDLPDTEREAFVAGRCGADRELYGRVQALLAADHRGGGFLDNLPDPDPDQTAAAGAAAPAAAGMDLGPLEPDPAVAAGQQLGPYRLISKIGGGGMGVVFLAERRDGQFEQTVALKVARMGLHGGALEQRRFLIERQILATLDHPNIARLLDGGVTDLGLPFFAMEYVQGETITEYCERRSLPLGPRLDLFLSVCAAVEHAHRRLVVHRDLKPSNILVTPAGEVKLLDFGIAKTLGDGAAGLTQTAQRILTPAYAAPEQIQGRPITTATDVYALGVVLYELLTGRLPHAAAAGSSPMAWMAAVLDSEPAKPSSVIARAFEARGSAPQRERRLQRALHGDLDTIVLAALKKEPERRYPAPEALADDLRRYQRGQPIRVRPDTLSYRAAKFVTRHRGAAATAALVLAALVAALGTALWQAQQRSRAALAAEREARASEEVTRFLMSLFEGSDPSRSRGAVVSAEELLDEGARRLRASLDDQPAVRARLLHTVAATYVALGLYGRARPLEEEALAERVKHFPPGAPQIAESLDEMGQIWWLNGDYARAEPLLRQALAIRRRNLEGRGGAGNRDGRGDAAAVAVAASLDHLGSLLHDRGNFQAADQAYREALRVGRQAYGAGDPESAQRLDDLGTNLQDMGRYGEAAALFRQALDARRRALGPDHPDVALSLHNLGAAEAALGDNPHAEAHLLQALALRRKVLGPDHPAVAWTEQALGDLYDGMERYDEAELHTRAALALFRATLGYGNRKIGESLNLLAALRDRRRDFAGAAVLFRDVLERCSRTLGPTHPDTLAVKNNLAHTLLHTGALAEAERLQRETLAQVRSDNGEPEVVMDRLNLGLTLLEEGRGAEAEGLIREAVDLERRLFASGHADLAMAYRWLAVAESTNGKAAAAEADLRASLRLAESLAPPSPLQVARSQIALGDLLVGERRPAAAEPLLRAAIGRLDGAHGADPIWRAEAQLLLAECARQGGAGNRDGSAARGAAARRTLEGLPGVAVDLYPTARSLLGRAARRAPGTATPPPAAPGGPG